MPGRRLAHRPAASSMERASRDALTARAAKTLSSAATKRACASVCAPRLSSGVPASSLRSQVSHLGGFFLWVARLDDLARSRET